MTTTPVPAFPCPSNDDVYLPPDGGAFTITINGDDAPEALSGIILMVGTVPPHSFGQDSKIIPKYI